MEWKELGKKDKFERNRTGKKDRERANFALVCPDKLNKFANFFLLVA